MIVATIAANLILWFMPKHLTRQEMYCTWLVMVFITREADQFLDLVFHLYDQLGPGVQWQVIVLQTLFPGAIGTIFLNFMPQNRLKFIAYLIACMCFSVIFEWITILTDYLTYRQWTLWYSAGVYIIGIILLRYHLAFLRTNRKT
ncbi:hypothetical protein EHS13_11825 [Paenibacillus psychroresistens]|uniref:Uncharacterized protein n=1 Tax=Paenibacillus psychroresistens TaxID=1778678 RepID=A0A6B8RJK6_9BACL|nr:hypothetical protein [Paenibacillus psychroresistens]QGQ95518.1 hypothetical protein EHS13_11825 [Paenibacillus psychroresistens]